MSVNVRSTKRTSDGDAKKPKVEEKVKIAEATLEILKQFDKLDVAEKFYALEDRIAAETEHVKLFDEFIANTQVLRKEIEQYMEGNPIVNNNIARLAKIRHTVRLAHYATAQLKKETSDKLDIVDAKLLQLQNTKSEVQHIQKEIDRCLDYSAGDEDIELVPVEEFYEICDVSLSNPEVTKTDEHQQYLARLKFEEEERRALQMTLVELEGRRNVLSSDIRGKEQRLQSLKPKVEALAAASEPIHEILGVKFKNIHQDMQQKQLATSLPSPLSITHIHSIAYKDIIEDNDFEVKIVGTNDGKVQKEENEKKRRKEDDNVRGKLEETSQKITEVHPMSLELMVSSQDHDISVVMLIQYIPELNVTTLKWIVNGSTKSKKSPLLLADSLMSDLFENDDGTECPNKIGELKLQELKISMDSVSKTAGKPYRFIQVLSGGDRISGVDATEHLRNIVNSIRERIQTRISLDQELREIDSQKSELLEGHNIKLASFKVIEDEKFALSIPSSLSELISQSTSTDRFSYKVELENSTTNKKLSVFISIPADYPRNDACVGIVAGDGSNENTIKDVENNVNSDPITLKEKLILIIKHFDLIFTSD